MRVVVPVERCEGLKSVIAEHFGRAPFFAVVELGDDGAVKDIRMTENTGEHRGGSMSVESLIGGLKPDAVIVKGMGPRGLSAFQSQGVAVFTGEAATVEGLIQALAQGQLRGLTEACREARHNLPQA